MQLQSLVFAALALYPSLSLAAGCNNEIGDRNLPVSRMNVNAICRSMRSEGGGMSTYDNDAFICTGSTSDGAYRWCEDAIQNIKDQCGNNYYGYYDFNWGSEDHYICASFTGGAEKCKRDNEAPSRIKRGKGKITFPNCL